MIATTSVDSLVEHKESGKAGIQRLEILNYLRAHPAEGFSRNDLARIFNLPIQSVCGRIGELKDEGLVVEDLPRPDPRTGRKVKPVRTAPDLLSTYH